MNDQINYFSVSYINQYISSMFQANPYLKNVYIKGEISNFKYSGPHCYFSLKDETSEISCTMFSSYNQYLKFIPKDGMNVQIKGDIGVYEKKGTYAVNVKQMTQEGIGILYQEFLNLQEKLGKEGLFDQKYKKMLPVYPSCVAVITSPTGEAVKDIISTFNKRCPLTKIKLFPALVQGKDAPSDLIRALKQVYNTKGIDAIIIGRGGGSFEDLSCFNDEELARVLFASPYPVVSGVGHEGDYTICDFVASFRAPTPTGAAMALSVDKNTSNQTIINLISRQKNAIVNKLIIANNFFQGLISNYRFRNFNDLLKQYESNLLALELKIIAHSPINNLNDKIKHVDNDLNHLGLLIKHYLDKKFTYFNSLLGKMDALNPVKVMDRGFSVVKQGDNVLTSIKQIQDDNVTIYFKDGKVDALINKNSISHDSIIDKK